MDKFWSRATCENENYKLARSKTIGKVNWIAAGMLRVLQGWEGAMVKCQLPLLPHN